MFQEIKNLIISFDIQEIQADVLAQRILDIISRSNTDEEGKVIIEDIPEIENKVLVQEESKKRGRKKQLS